MTMTEKLDLMIQPRSIAILGCSENNIGGRVLQNMLKSPVWKGQIYPINLKKESIHGVKCYKKLADIPGEVDCCVVALRSTLIPNALDEMHEKGIYAAVMFASGFSEVGEEGRQLQQVVSRKLKEYGIAACGPNCIGLYNTEKGIYLWGDPYKLENRPGGIGVVAHSGAVSIVLSNSGRDIGYSKVISCGNEAGVAVHEYMRYLVDDAQTEMIVCFLETIRNPDGFMEAAQYALSKNKPVIALRVGRSETGQKTAAAHSGALATPTAVMDAFFEKCGVVTVESIDELLEACELLLKLKNNLPQAPTLGMTAISGGLLSLASDMAADEKVSFATIAPKTTEELRKVLPEFSTPHNPLDVSIALFDPAAYQECIRILAKDPAVGMVLVCQECESALLEDQDYIYWDIVKALRDVAADLGKPMAVFSPFMGGLHPSLKAILDEGGVPLTQGAQATMRAVKILYEYQSYRQRLTRQAGGAAKSGSKTQVEFGTLTSLGEGESKKLLKAYDIPVAGDALVQSAEQAVAAAEEMGYPVVMKIDSPDIQHKTEAKVVRLNVTNSDQVRTVYGELMANAAAYDAKARINGVSVQEMVVGGTEVILGMKNDPAFGPSIMVGLGGIFVEVFKDFSLRLAPIDMDTAYEMIDELKGKKVLMGARGAAEGDIEALAQTMVKLSDLAVDNADQIGELDINPILVLPKGRGVKAVDALIVKK